MPRHSRNSRREWVSFYAYWLGAFALTCGFAVAEAGRIEAARATVAEGWGAGILVGAGAGFALAPLCAVMLRVRHRRPWTSGPQALFLLVVALLSLAVVFISTPPRQFGSHPAPHVVTSAAEVAEIAYVGACLTQFAVLIAVAGALALARGRRRLD